MSFNPDDFLGRGAEFVECPDCSRPNKAQRLGAQDGCDIYRCGEGHLTRIKIDAPRKEWKHEDV